VASYNGGMRGGARGSGGWRSTALFSHHNIGQCIVSNTPTLRPITSLLSTPGHGAAVFRL
jgi:hypothetical protein